MAKAPKQGIYDELNRKVVGVLRCENGFSVDVNENTVNLAEVFKKYDGCDIIIHVFDNRGDGNCD